MAAFSTMSGRYTFSAHSAAVTSSKATDTELVAVVQNRGDVFGDRLREPAFLLLRLPWPKFDDDVRHGSFPYFTLRSARYWSSLTCSIQSTFLPSSCSCTAMCVKAVVVEAPCQSF